MFEPVAPADVHAHLAGLNRSFADWGSHDRLAWVLRPFDGQAPDIFAAERGGELVAGSIVSYRVVAQADATSRVAIMTGSWTDPHMRGRGMFSAMIEHSAALAREQGAVALLAFVTSDNASRRRLEAAGSILIPTWYVSVPAASLGDAWTDAGDVDAALAVLDAHRSATAAARGRFVYPTAADLQCHLLDRSPYVRVLESTRGAVTVIERAGRTLRVLACSDASQRPSAAGIDDLFSFTSDPRSAQEATAIDGARVTPGFLTVLPLTDAWQTPSEWYIESGDRI